MFGNISQILEMKKKADELKAKLETIQVTEEHLGITVDCNGNRKLLAIHIPEQLMSNKTQLEEALTEVTSCFRTCSIGLRLSITLSNCSVYKPFLPEPSSATLPGRVE